MYKCLIPAGKLVVVEVLKESSQTSKFVDPEKEEKTKRHTICKIVSKGNESKILFHEESTILVYTHMIETDGNFSWISDSGIIGQLES